MNGRILVCVASRDRNLALERMVDSVLMTSKEADVAVYIDEDQWEDYRRIVARDRVHHVCGPRLGPARSLNALCGRFPGYEVYGAATDDCEFVTTAWDEWAVRESMSHPISMLAPHLPGSKRMDFPWATKTWLDLVGYLAIPSCHHYYWDVALEVLAEQTCVRRATPEQFTIVHDDAPSENLKAHALNDAREAVLWIAFERPKLLKKIREAMA